MFFVFDYNVHYDYSSRQTAYKQTLRLAKGQLNQVELFFPPGSHQEVHVIIKHGRSQIFPSNNDGSFTGDDVNISFNTSYRLNSAPYELVAEMWNDDTEEYHHVTIRIGITPDKSLSQYEQETKLQIELEDLMESLT